MKKIILAAAMLMGTAWVGQAQAELPTATPAWACHLSAKIVKDNRFYFVLKIDDMTAVGTVSCASLTGTHLKSKKVIVTIKGLGIGAGFGFKPAEASNLDIYAVKAGISTPSSMYGEYALQAGPGVTLLGSRVAVEAGASVTPVSEIGGALQVNVTQLIGIGLDLSASVMDIEPMN